MALKKTVAFERRIDLASLFCLIGRHGPAVLLALAAIACLLLAGLVIYRRLRDKRRRRAAAAAEDRDSSAGQRGAALGLWEEGEPGSTDASDESSPDDLKEAVSHRPGQTVRHRRAAAERNKDKLPHRDDSDNKVENAFVWDSNSHRATERFAEETKQNLQNDFTNRDVMEELCGTEEPELKNDCDDEEKVLEPDTSEDITTTNEDVSEEEGGRREEDTVQSTFNSQLCFSPTPDLSSTDRNKDNTQETEPDSEKLEDSTVPGLKSEETSAPHIDDDIVDQQQNAIVQNMSMHCGEFNSVLHLNDEKQTGEPYNGPLKVKEECYLIASSNLINVNASNNDSVLVSTNDVNAPETTDITDPSSNSLQQSEPQTSPTLDAEIDQNGPCPQEPSHHETKVQTDTKKSDSQKACEIVSTDASGKDFPITIADDGNSIGTAEKVSHHFENKKAKHESEDHQEPAEKVEIETSTLPESTYLEEQGPMPQVQDMAQNHLSDQKANTGEEQHSQSIHSQNNQDLKDISSDTFEASAAICDNIAACIIKQAVAEVCISKEVQKTARKEGVCSNMAQIQAAGFCLEVKVEGEKESLSDIKTETLKITAVSNGLEQPSFEQKGPAIGLDSNKCQIKIGNFPLLIKMEGEQKSASAVKTEDLETTATVTEDEQQRGPDVPLDTNIDQSNKSVSDDCQRTAACETFHATVSAAQISECENVLMVNTSPFKPASSDQMSTCHYHIVSNETPAIEVFRAEVVTLTAPTVIEETAHVERLSSPLDQENDHTESNTHFKMTSGAVLDFAQGNDPSKKSSEQIELKDSGVSSPVLESGISSMTVSPEEEEASEQIGLTVGGISLSECDPMLLSQETATACKVHSGEQVSEGVCSISDTTTSFVQSEVSELIGPLASSPVLLSSPEDISDESLVTNEDSFGSEIEDCYQKAMEELMTQVVDNLKNSCGEMSTQMEQKDVEAVEKKVKASVVKKEDGEQVVDSEKTEISIMEATMDHNEWITDGSYQVLPWMNTPSLSKDNITSKETQRAEDTKPPAFTPSAEENTEYAKKVLAVQPMPQNVNVTFRVHYLTLSPYQAVAVTGDQQELGGWKSVVPLEKSKDGYWSCVVSLPAESHVEWKFVVLDKGEVCRWEECGNRVLYTGYGDDLLVHKWWGFM